jgi:hypothetical protein
MIPFTSGGNFSQALQDCLARGWFPFDRSSPLPGYELQSELFSFIPSVEHQDVTGRLVRLHFPGFADLSGDLAVRVEVTREGEVTAKELLFSTNPKLGLMVIEALEGSLEIAKPGSGSGPFVDVLRLKIVNGELAVFGQTHHAKSKE